MNLVSQAPGKLLSIKQRWCAKKLQLFGKTPSLDTIPEQACSCGVLLHLLKNVFLAPIGFPVWTAHGLSAAYFSTCKIEIILSIIFLRL